MKCAVIRLFRRANACASAGFRANDGGLFAAVKFIFRKYTSLESRELEELPRFGVMTWQPFQLP